MPFNANVAVYPRVYHHAILIPTEHYFANRNSIQMVVTPLGLVGPSRVSHKPLCPDAFHVYLHKWSMHDS